jgi:hypothetical protein
MISSVVSTDEGSISFLGTLSQRDGTVTGSYLYGFQNGVWHFFLPCFLGAKMNIPVVLVIS